MLLLRYWSDPLFETVKSDSVDTPVVSNGLDVCGLQELFVDMMSSCWVRWIHVVVKFEACLLHCKFKSMIIEELSVNWKGLADHATHSLALGQNVVTELIKESLEYSYVSSIYFIW